MSLISSNVDEVIKTILDFFIQKFHKYIKAQYANKRTGIKKVTSLFCAFVLLLGCAFVLLVLLFRSLFVKKSLKLP